MKHLLLISSVFFLALASCGSEKNKSPYVIALGIAQDGGVPQAGCTKVCCKNRWMKSKKEIYVTSLGIVDPNSKEAWIIEASPDFPFQHKKLSADNEVKGLFITHAHMGHYTGLVHLGREAMGYKNMPLFVASKMANFLKNNGPWSQLVELDNVNLNIIYSNKSLKLNKRLSIVPFQVPHRDEFSETVGFKIQGPKKNLIFIPDIDKWSRWGDDVLSIIKSNDFALLDGTFYDGEELPGRDMSEIPHPFIVESLDFFDSIKDEVQIHFIHINHTNPVLDSSSKQYKEVLEKGFGVVKMDQRYEL